MQLSGRRLPDCGQGSNQLLLRGAYPTSTAAAKFVTRRQSTAQACCIESDTAVQPRPGCRNFMSLHEEQTAGRAAHLHLV